MIRDQLKDSSYFDSFISKQYQRLGMFESRLLDNKALNEKVIKNIRYATFNISFQIIVSRYSRGDSLTAIKEDYIKSIPKFKVVFSEIIDMNTLQFIALSVLLNVNLFDDEEFLLSLEKFNISNGMIDIFMKKEDIIEISSYKDIKQFRPWIAELYNKPDEREAIISKQLSNWYRSQRSSYFFGYDKEEEPLYFGYWALEIAALVKILNIPDDSFKDHKYYPYDLVHFGG